MALTPEQIAEIQRLKALMQQPAADAQRKAQAAWNAEQMANKKANGGLESFLKDSKVKSRVYHGTQSDFSEFKSGPRNRIVKGVYFAQDPETANFFAGQGEGANVIPAHLQMKNPATEEEYERIIDSLPFEAKRTSAQRTAQLKKHGYDGLIMNAGTGNETYISFHPNQIKSAIGNRGTYDTNESDITKAKGGEVSQDVMRLALMAKGGAPKKTVTAYKMFRVDPKRPGQLFPLFVDADTPVPMGEWVDAIEGAMSKGKVKSKIGPLAYRPGWHAGDLSLATHIGDKDAEQKAEVARIQALRQEMLTDIGEDKEGKKIVKKMYPYPKWVNAPRLRNPRHIWAEIEMPHDVDWQAEAEKRGYNDQGKFVANRAHITDQLPKGGHYRYKTNANMTGNWLIGGAMKVNKILNDADVAQINERANTADLPRLKPLKKEVFGFAHGGVTHAHHLDIEERPL